MNFDKHQKNAKNISLPFDKCFYVCLGIVKTSVDVTMTKGLHHTSTPYYLQRIEWLQCGFFAIVSNANIFFKPKFTLFLSPIEHIEEHTHKNKTFSFVLANHPKFIVDFKKVFGFI